MRASEFLRRVRHLGKARGVVVTFEPSRGKGSHGTLFFGGARTVLQDLKNELPRGTMHAMLKQLGLSVRDFE